MQNNKYLIILGSNSNRGANITSASQRLCQLFPVHLAAEAVETAPIGMPNSLPFTNRCLAVLTDKSYDELRIICKALEKEMGRKVEDKNNGIVKIDIDIVAMNGTVLKPEDYARDYAKNFASEYEKFACEV